MAIQEGDQFSVLISAQSIESDIDNTNTNFESKDKEEVSGAVETANETIPKLVQRINEKLESDDISKAATLNSETYTITKLVSGIDTLNKKIDSDTYTKANKLEKILIKAAKLFSFGYYKAGPQIDTSNLKSTLEKMQNVSKFVAKGFTHFVGREKAKEIEGKNHDGYLYVMDKKGNIEIHVQTGTSSMKKKTLKITKLKIDNSEMKIEGDKKNERKSFNKIINDVCGTQLRNLSRAMADIKIIQSGIELTDDVTIEKIQEKLKDKQGHGAIAYTVTHLPTLGKITGSIKLVTADNTHNITIDEHSGSISSANDRQQGKGCATPDELLSSLNLKLLKNSDMKPTTKSGSLKIFQRKNARS